MSNRQIVLDTETTGLSWETGHRIIEIGAIELIDRKITGSVFHVYIDPEREVDQEAQRVHGLDWENLIALSDGKKFSDICQSFIDFIGDSELVIHNASFDVGFLNSELRRLGRREISVKIVDTLAMARNMLPNVRANLNSLARHHGIDVSHREYHGALLDAEILADVYLALTIRQDKLLLDAKKDSHVNVKTHAREVPSYEPIPSDIGLSLPVVKASETELEANKEMSARIISKSKDSEFSL